MLLVLENVRKSYGKFVALKGLSFSFEPGSIGLLGPNGAGKSTLLKVLLGLLPFEGNAQILGFDPARQSTAIRAALGYMPEKDSYVANLNAVELCTYAGELSGLPRADAVQRAHASLEYVGLGDKRYQNVEQYSTGQKQRVKLAQALVHDPKVLLLDEPTNGLDPDGREEMLALLRDIPQRTGCSLFLSSHLLHDVERVCDRVILMHQGEALYAGPIATLQQQGVENEFDVRLKAGEEALATALRARGATVDVSGANLRVRLPDDAKADLIFATAESAGLQVRHLEPHRLTLETAYVKAVNESNHG